MYVFIKHMFIAEAESGD